MEPVGLTLGLVGLAGLFNNAVDCFEYIQLGRGFGPNFQTSLLKLDNTRLKLSRWGQSVGLTADVETVQSLHQTSVLTEDVPKAEQVLGEVLKLFADAERVSDKFKKRTSTKESSLVVYNADTDLDLVGASLHQRMRELSIKRQNRTPLWQKAKWALYEEKHFKRLIEDVTDLVNDLRELFPSAQASQRELCEFEVKELGTGQNLALLKDIAADQDMELEAAISKALKAKGGVTNTWNNYDNSKVGKQVETENIYGSQSITF